MFSDEAVTGTDNRGFKVNHDTSFVTQSGIVFFFFSFLLFNDKG